MHTIDLVKPYFEAEGFTPFFAVVSPPVNGLVTLLVLIKDEKFDLYGVNAINISPLNLVPSGAFLTRAAHLLSVKGALQTDFPTAATLLSTYVNYLGLQNTLEYQGFLSHFNLGA